MPVVADRDEGAAWWHTQYTGRRGIPGLSEGSGYVYVCVCVISSPTLRLYNGITVMLTS